MPGTRCAGWRSTPPIPAPATTVRAPGSGATATGWPRSLFLHHVSRDGDPQLHVHVAVWNRVQRADKADDKWRTLHGRALYQNGWGWRRSLTGLSRPGCVTWAL